MDSYLCVSAYHPIEDPKTKLEADGQLGVMRHAGADVSYRLCSYFLYLPFPRDDSVAYHQNTEFSTSDTAYHSILGPN